jgi:TorA maturation chaperone TorD
MGEALKNAAPPPPPLAAEEQSRADVYGLLARLLVRPPDQALLQQLSALEGDNSPIGEAFAALGEAARRADLRRVEREYHDLFIGLGRGELVPFGSYYLTGFVNEKPLAKLRASMAELGVERDPAVKEPEDHIASELDIMAGLIAGAFPTGRAVLQRQRAFFSAHLQPWASHFFKDLERLERADFYKPVGTLGRLLIELEAAAFDMS